MDKSTVLPIHKDSLLYLPGVICTQERPLGNFTVVICSRSSVVCSACLSVDSDAEGNKPNWVNQPGKVWLVPRNNSELDAIRPLSSYIPFWLMTLKVAYNTNWSCAKVTNTQKELTRHLFRPLQVHIEMKLLAA